MEEADEAGEGRGVERRGMVGGAFRGWVDTVSGPRRSRPSQIIRGVRRLNWRCLNGWTSLVVFRSIPT